MFLTHHRENEMALTAASKQLFNRDPDERCETLHELATRCQAKKQASIDQWKHPTEIRTVATGNGLGIVAGDDGFSLNSWSFGQLCRLAGVAADTVNKLSSETANRVFQETLPRDGKKPLQLFIEDKTIRSIHGTQYQRLWDTELVQVLQEFAVDFQPPQKGYNGATGLYLGEQDMFAFMIDPLGVIEVNGEAFFPGFFAFNSEVGKRALGLSTFWFQSVCQNHLVHDAIEVVDFTRKHTAKVHEGLSHVRKLLCQLVEKRDERKDGMFRILKKAMDATLGEEAEDVLKIVTKHGINRSVATKALELAREKGRFTIFSVVDALTRMARELEFAGDRTEADRQASTLLELVEA